MKAVIKFFYIFLLVITPSGLMFSSVLSQSPTFSLTEYLVFESPYEDTLILTDEWLFEDAAWSKDGSKFAFWYKKENNYKFQIYDVETGELVEEKPVYFDISQPLAWQTNGDEEIAWSPDGQKVAEAHPGAGHIDIWSAESQKVICEIDIPYSGKFGWDATSTLLAVDSGKSLDFWDYKTCQTILSVDVPQDFAWHPSQTQIAYNHPVEQYEDEVAILNPMTGEREYFAFPEGVLPDFDTVSWNPNGRQLLVDIQHPEYSPLIWDIRTGESDTVPKFLVAAWHPDGQWLALVDSAIPQVTIWDTILPQPLAQVLIENDNNLRSLQWSPNGKWLMGAFYDGTVYIWGE